MTIQSAVYRKEYTGTGATEFPFTRILDEAQVAVYVNGVLQALNVAYTVSGVGDAVGATVTFGTAPALGASVVLLLDVPITQLTDFVESDRGLADTKEDVADKLTLIDLQQQEEIGRSLKLSDTSLYSSPILPDPVIGKTLEWSATTPPTLRNVTPAVTGIATPVSVVNGGTGLDMSALSGYMRIDAGVVTAREDSARNDFRLVQNAGYLGLEAVTGTCLNIAGITYDLGAQRPVLSADGLTPNILYNIYAYRSYGAVQLYPTTVGYTNDPDTGRVYIIGDQRYVLMGQAATTDGPAWDTRQTMLISAQHKMRKRYTETSTVNGLGATAPWWEVNQQLRVPFLTWGTDPVAFAIMGGSYRDQTPAISAWVTVGLDGTTPIPFIGQLISSPREVLADPVGFYGESTIATGYHYATVLAGVDPVAVSNYVLLAGSAFTVSIIG